MQTWLRRKDIDRVTVHEEGRRLVPTLSWPHLVALGIGAIVGTGIYTLIGVAANLAGPAVLVSFLVAGIVCACAALAYAEMATLMPAAATFSATRCCTASVCIPRLTQWLAVAPWGKPLRSTRSARSSSAKRVGRIRAEVSNMKAMVSVM